MKDFEPRRIGIIAGAAVFSLAAVLPGCRFIDTPVPTKGPAIPTNPTGERSSKNEYMDRLNSIRSVPGNEQTIVWPNVLNANSPEKGEQDKFTVDRYRRLILADCDLKCGKGIKIDFTTENEPTFRFINGSIKSDNKNYPSVFLDSSGRFKKGNGLSQIIDSIPDITHYTINWDTYSKDLNLHFFGIDAGNIKDGFVMVFSKPAGIQEDKNSEYDIWELDTTVYSENTNVTFETGHSHGYGYFVLGTQDRTDRKEDFYSKDNPKKVEKIAIILDKNGKAVGKTKLEITEFSPKRS